MDIYPIIILLGEAVGDKFSEKIIFVSGKVDKFHFTPISAEALQEQICLSSLAAPICAVYYYEFAFFRHARTISKKGQNEKLLENYLKNSFKSFGKSSGVL